MVDPDVQVALTSTNATGAAFSQAQKAVASLEPVHKPHPNYLNHDIEQEEEGFALYATAPCTCGDKLCVWSVGATINRYIDGEQV
jgi:hypothetical protein